MVKSKTLAALMVSATLMGSAFYSAPSYAAAAGNTGSGSSMINLGALLGLGILNNNLGNQFVLGLDGGYKIMPNIMVGGYFTYNSLTSFPGVSSSLFTIAPEASFVLGEETGVLSGSRIGAKAGVGIASNAAGNTSSGSSTGFVFGPHVAYDRPIANGITLGGEANYMIYTQTGGFNALNLLATLKYWF